MSLSNVTHNPAARVTAVVRRVADWVRQPRLSERALRVLDLATQANAKVYEAGDHRSFAVDGTGHVRDVTREIRELEAYGRRGCVEQGSRWVAISHRGAVGRIWSVTPQGRLALIKAGRRQRPGSAKPVQS